MTKWCSTKAAQAVYQTEQAAYQTEGSLLCLVHSMLCSASSIAQLPTPMHLACLQIGHCSTPNCRMGRSFRKQVTTVQVKKWWRNFFYRAPIFLLRGVLTSSDWTSIQTILHVRRGRAEAVPTPRQIWCRTLDTGAQQRVGPVSTRKHPRNSRHRYY